LATRNNSCKLGRPAGARTAPTSDDEPVSNQSLCDEEEDDDDDDDDDDEEEEEEKSFEFVLKIASNVFY